jgi:hypothetical protein
MRVPAKTGTTEMGMSSVCKRLGLWGVVSFTVLGAWARPAAADDLLWWKLFTAKYRPIEDLTLSLTWRDNIADFHQIELFYIKGGPIYQVLDWLEVGFIYRFQRSGDRVWRTEHRLEPQFSFEWELASFEFDDRNQFEVRIFPHKPDEYRYRNKLEVARKVTLADFQFKPFLAVEPYYDFSAKALNKNRVYAGAGKKLGDIFGIKLFYVLESTEDDGAWGHTHVVATQFDISI